MSWSRSSRSIAPALESYWEARIGSSVDRTVRVGPSWTRRVEARAAVTSNMGDEIGIERVWRSSRSIVPALASYWKARIGSSVDRTVRVGPSLSRRVEAAAAVTSSVGDEIGIERVWRSPIPKNEADVHGEAYRVEHLADRP